MAKHVDRRAVLEGVAGSALGSVFIQDSEAAPKRDLFQPRDGSGTSDGETFSPANQDWLTVSEGETTVYYKEEYQNDAETTLQYHRDAVSFGQETLPSDVAVDLTVKLYCYPGEEWNRSEYTLFWRDYEPPEVYYQAPSDAPDDIGERWYRSGIGHELYNIVLWNYAVEKTNYQYYQRNPSWFPEGLSEYITNRQPVVFEEHPDYGVQQIYEQIKKGDGWFGSVSQSKYHGGHVLCEFLIDEYGYQPLFDVLANDTTSFSQAIEDELGITRWGLSLQWLTWASENIGGSYDEGLPGIANDIRTDNVDTATLREVIDAWRSE